MSTLNTSGRTGLELVLVRQFNATSDPGPRLQLIWDGEASVMQYTLLVDPINLIGVVVVDMIHSNSFTRNSGMGIIFMVDSNKILYMRECDNLNLINDTYDQLVINEMSNNQLGFIETLTLNILVTYTQKLWSKRLGYMLS